MSYLVNLCSRIINNDTKTSVFKYNVVSVNQRLELYDELRHVKDAQGNSDVTAMRKPDFRNSSNPLNAKNRFFFKNHRRYKVMMSDFLQMIFVVLVQNRIWVT